MKANFRLITKQGRIQWLFREVKVDYIVHKSVTARFTQYTKNHRDSFWHKKSCIFER